MSESYVAIKASSPPLTKTRSTSSPTSPGYVVLENLLVNCLIVSFLPGDAESVGGSRHSRHNLTATIGLVFHAAGE